jgi:hypothetical protein
LAEGRQTFPAAASDGVSYFVVWSDTRSGSESDIYGARVTATGKVLDQEGIAITTAAHDQFNPDVTFDGENYLVVWEDERSGGESYSKRGDIYCARVAPSGEVLDPESIPVSIRGNREGRPVIASDGARSLVVWRDHREEQEHVYGARIDLSGNVLDQGGIPVTRGIYEQSSPEVTFNGTDYVVAWYQRHPDMGLNCTRVSTSGEVIDPDGWVVSAQPDRSEFLRAIVSGEESALVMWSQSNPGQNRNIYGSRVTASATVLDPEPFPITLGPNQQLYPAAAASGAHFTVAWMDYRCGRRDIYATRIDDSGFTLDSYPVAVVTSGRVEGQHMAAAGTDGGALLVWVDSREGPEQVFGARVSSLGDVLDPEGFNLCQLADEVSDLAVASDGVDFMAVWTDRRGGNSNPRIYGNRIGRRGGAPNPNGVAISPAGKNEDPAIAFGRDQYLVVWIESERINSGLVQTVVGSRISPSGAVLDPEGIEFSPISDKLYDPAIAFDGSNYLVAWFHDHDKFTDVRGVLVSDSGEVLDRFAISVGYRYRSEGPLSATFDGTYFVLSWLFDYFDRGVDCCRIRPSGEVIDSKPFAVSGLARVRSAASIATSARGRTLMTYAAYTDQPFECYRIWGSLLTANAIEPALQFVAVPNPFQTSVKIYYNLPGDARVRLSAFDVMGRLVKTVAHGYREPGPHQETWDGTDEDGRKVPSGIYFLRLQSRHGIAGTRCILVR